MKELSLLSLICSCFHTQPHPNTIYQYGGKRLMQTQPAESTMELFCRQLLQTWECLSPLGWAQSGESVFPQVSVLLAFDF